MPNLRSRVRIPPTAAVYQRQLSVPSLRGRLMSTSGSWGVNGHTTPRDIRGLAASAGVRLRANETEISATPWALRLGKGLYFTLLNAKVCPPYYNMQLVIISVSYLLLVHATVLISSVIHNIWTNGDSDRNKAALYQYTILLACCVDNNGCSGVASPTTVINVAHRRVVFNSAN